MSTRTYSVRRVESRLNEDDSIDVVSDHLSSDIELGHFYGIIMDAIESGYRVDVYTLITGEVRANISVWL